MRRLKVSHGLFLIFLSLFLIMAGFIFDAVHMNDSVIEYIIPDKKKDSPVHITTIDGRDYLPPNNSQNTDKQSIEENPSEEISNNPTTHDSTSVTNAEKGNETNSTDSSNDNSVDSNVSASNNEKAIDFVIPVEDTTEGIKDSSFLRKKIENTYGVTVLYGDEMKEYVVGGYSVEAILDDNIIYENLVQLEKCLSLYPIGFFQEMKDNGLSLTIGLIKKYSSINVTGITQKKKNSVTITIATDYPFEDSFHHENYHYIEHYITKKGGNYSNWNNYNPNNFTYGNIDKSQAYDVTFSPYSYFVNVYAQSYEYEDRACTFEYMMADNKISAFNYGNNIWKKAKVMSETIDYYYTTVNSSTIEYWERFLQ